MCGARLSDSFAVISVAQGRPSFREFEPVCEVYRQHKGIPNQVDRQPELSSI